MSNFNFAYIEGQETEALDFYEKKLEGSREQNEREALRAMVEMLRKKVLAKYGTLPKPSNSLSALKHA